MNLIKTTYKELKCFLILWSTQALSQLGSSMTNYALIVWSYTAKGSALTTALLSVFSYVPYVIMSIFAGSLSDKWNKKITMLISDTFAAFCTISIFVLLKTGKLEIWHLYGLNALNGLMNTVQQPASDVAITLLTPKKHYQKVSGMRSFSNALISILTPIIATAVLSFTNLQTIIYIDLITFVIAFVSLAFFVKIPEYKADKNADSFLALTKSGLTYLKQNRGILDLILFLACINFIASIYNAAFPAMILSKENGGEIALGTVNAFIGVATLIGSIVASLMATPKSRVKVICNALLISMSTENFLLALGKTLPLWCIGGVLGWLCIPVMNANMDVLFRERIPVHMQGRVYAARNTFQFFTIPLGYILGGFLVDKIFEPFMEKNSSIMLAALFGTGKGSGAAFLFMFLAFIGIIICLVFRKDKNIWKLE
ncbi:MAG: MFS transporter, partial [Eubacterium sp.]|nr:MFS transporter [Eubacterium sp.]